MEYNDAATQTIITNDKFLMQHQLTKDSGIDSDQQMKSSSSSSNVSTTTTSNISAID